MNENQGTGLRGIEALGDEAERLGLTYRTDDEACPFCQQRDHTGTAAHYHPDTRYPSCGGEGCGIDYRDE